VLYKSSKLAVSIMLIPFLSFIEPLSLFHAYLLIVAFLLVVFALYDRSYKSYVFKNLYVLFL
jgi:hypothetical protein